MLLRNGITNVIGIQTIIQFHHERLSSKLRVVETLNKKSARDFKDVVLCIGHGFPGVIVIKLCEYWIYRLDELLIQFTLVEV